MATKKATTTAVVDWAEEMARQAKVAAAMAESMSTGSWFGLKAGVLKFNGDELPDNQMGVIILASALENAYYDEPYDSENPTSPKCFAIELASGTALKTIAPHALVTDAGNQQCGPSGTCAGCDKNQFGSAEKGKGKACSNKMRLALIPAGKLTSAGQFTPTKGADHYATAQIAKLRIPTMSTLEYNGFVKRVAGALQLPPHGVYCKIKVVPDAKSQFRVTFQELTRVPNEYLGALMSRLEEAQKAIEEPGYSLPEEKPAAKPSPQKKRAAKTADQQPAATRPAAPAKTPTQAAPAAKAGKARY